MARSVPKGLHSFSTELGYINLRPGTSSAESLSPRAQGQGGPSKQFPSAFGPSHREGRGSPSVQAQIQGAPRGLQRLHGGWGREVGSGERRRSARTHGPSPRPAWHLQPPPRFSWRRARRPQRAPRLYLGARQLAAPACLPCRDTQVTGPQEPIGSRGLGP